MNKDACKDALRLVRDSLIDRNWHAYVRGFIEKIDPCRSMVNLFIGPSPRVRFINSERWHRNCLGNRYYDSSLPGVKPWIYFTVTNHSRREYFCLRIPILTLIARVSILNRIFLPFLFAVVLDRGNFRLEGLFPFVGSEVDDYPKIYRLNWTSEEEILAFSKRCINERIWIVLFIFPLENCDRFSI